MATKRTATKPGNAPAADDPRFEAVVRAFAKDTQVSQGKMFGSVGLKVGGKVFAMLVKGSLVVKLPREHVDELVAGGTGSYFDPGHGKLMKEWVALAGRESSWPALARAAHRFVKGGQR